MKKSRRGFIAATAALAASELTRQGIAAEPRDGRKAMTQNVANATLPGTACAPLPSAVVDVWHADAEGMYSNVGSDVQNVDTLGGTFMRGHQITGGDGRVEFDTVVPGWELVPPPLNMVVRATHIHVKVFHDHKIATTQLYFPDSLLDQLYAEVDPYRANRRMTVPSLKGRMIDRIRNGEDQISVGGQSAPMNVTRQGDVLVAEATIGLVTIGTLGTKMLFR